LFGGRGGLDEEKQGETGKKAGCDIDCVSQMGSGRARFQPQNSRFAARPMANWRELKPVIELCRDRASF
jgi:hypothetical protein